MAIITNWSITTFNVFNFKAGLHQNLLLGPLLFIIVLETLLQEFRTGCPWELLYTDDHVLLADTMTELLSKLGNS